MFSGQATRIGQGVFCSDGNNHILRAGENPAVDLENGNVLTSCCLAAHGSTAGFSALRRYAMPIDTDTQGEIEFRRGFSDGILCAIEALESGVLPRQLRPWAESVIDRWQLGHDDNFADVSVPPPPPRPWAEIRAEILKRDNYICEYCGKEADSVDHIRPVCKGGTDDAANLVSSCRRCNSKKGKKLLSEWKPRLRGHHT